MNRIQKRDLDIHLGEEKLEIKEFVKCVGIYINSELTRGKHTQSISFRLQKGIDIIREMWHFLLEKQLKFLFSAFMSSYLGYGVLVSGGAAKAHVNKLDRSLRKTIRFILFKDKKYTAKPLCEHLKILPLELNTKFTTYKIHQTTYLRGAP